MKITNITIALVAAMFSLNTASAAESRPIMQNGEIAYNLMNALRAMGATYQDVLGPPHLNVDQVQCDILYTPGGITITQCKFNQPGIDKSFSELGEKAEKLMSAMHAAGVEGDRMVKAQSIHCFATNWNSLDFDEVACTIQP